MEIPDQYSTREFQLVLLNMARELLQRCGFPAKLYDNDMMALCEEIVADTYVRILQMEGEGIKSSGLFYVTMRFIVLEKRKDAWKARNAGWEKAPGATSSLEGDEQTADTFEPVADERTAPDGAAQDQELLAIIDQELDRLPNRWPASRKACFRRMALAVFSDDVSFSEAWERVCTTCPDSPSRANAFLWWNRLLIAVFKIWAPKDDVRGAAL
jgi:hypothetical protein